jgi:ubiquinone/menaquinone biosynthesis C-methylase UbiE
VSGRPRGSYGDATGDAASAEAERLRQQATRLWHRERGVLERLGFPKGARVLEVGCGAGALLGRVAADFHPRALVGVDRAEDNLRRARDFAPVARADGGALPFADGSFDVVLFRFVLRHAPAPTRLLGEARRVLAPGGHVVAVDADDGSLLLDPEPRAWPELRAALEATARRRGGDPFVGRRLRRLLLEAGFAEARADVLAVSTADVGAAVFVDVFLAPAARPVDGDLLSADAAARAWAEVRAWTGRADAFACASGFFAAARNPPP